MTDSISSLAWGNKSFPISQGHGVPGFRPDWYKYSATLGFPSGYHLGLDVPMPAGTPIYALNHGKVIQEGFSNSFRPYPVWIETIDNPSTPEDESGYIEIYGHLSSEVVTKGQTVQPGQLVGYSGEQTVQGTTTPDGSGAHIHFELRKPDASIESGYRAVDPSNWLQGATGVPDDSGGGSGGGGGLSFPDFGINAGIERIESAVGETVRRSFFILLGLGLLWIGLNKILEVHTGFSPRRTVKKAAKTASKATVAGRVAR